MKTMIPEFSKTVHSFVVTGQEEASEPRPVPNTRKCTQPYLSPEDLLLLIFLVSTLLSGFPLF